MINKTELSYEELKDLQNTIYSMFESGYAFEEFLKEYLVIIGLDEVKVTKRSRDGGIDLTAVRTGIGDFSTADKTYYYVQAKRYKPDNKISVHTIRELKGVVPFGHKGMIITTSDFSGPALQEANNDISKPIVTVNGIDLVRSCIDNGIGFIYKPVFSKNKFRDFITSQNTISSSTLPTSSRTVDYIEKLITANDIRARIISIPADIMSQMSGNQSSVKVIVNNNEYQCSINRPRNYLGSVTQIFHAFNLIQEDGTVNPKMGKWYYDTENSVIILLIEE